MLSNKLTVIFICLLFLTIALGGCNGHEQKVAEKKVVPDTVLKGNFEPASGLTFDSLALSTFIKANPQFSEFSSDLEKLYRLHEFNYVWYDRQGITEAASNLINHLQTQQSDGVLKNFPEQPEFLKMVNQLQNGEAQKPKTDVEFMLSAQYFNYAKNVWGGAAADKAIDNGWYLPKKKLNYVELLQQQLQEPKGNMEQLAVVPQYLLLKQALNNYQKLEKAGPDVEVPFRVGLSKLVLGDSAQNIVLLRKRLHQLGDLKEQSGSNIFDQELDSAIIHFKERHGIKPSSKITSGFITQLNVTIHKRIEQMIINLERMRWIPVDDHGGEFILVNIPEYKLHYYIDNKLIWDSKVVVGKVMNKTVIFSGHLHHIVFSPYWYIPTSIINKEIKPGMAKNPNYLANHNMQWNNGQVRQKPGKKNSLGLVKFIFPNVNNIYLHDTPSKSLFDEDDRAFSHGCIRVAEPRQLAIQILKQLPAWTPEKIDAAMHAGTERTVVLPKKIPVYIGYFTAFVNHKGELNFRTDVYNRDGRLLDFLMQ